MRASGSKCSGLATQVLCSCETFQWLAACRTCQANCLKVTRLLQHQGPPDSLIDGTGGMGEPCWLISSLKVQTPNRASAHASFVSFCAVRTCTNNGATQALCFSALRTIQSDRCDFTCGGCSPAAQLLRHDRCSWAIGFWQWMALLSNMIP